MVKQVAAEKTPAIVLRVIDFSESSCVCTLYTRDFGRITGLAKGARRPKGPFESALDLLSLVRLVFLRKSSDVLDLLTEAKLERRFRAAAKDLARLYAGYYVAEFLLDFTHDDDADPELFEIAHAAIRSLDDAGHVPTTIVRFEIAALQRLGHWPSLRFCAGCGEETEPGPRIALGVIAGGALCAQCRPRHRTVVSLSRAAWETLVREEEGENLPEKIEGAVRGELRGFLNHYVCHLLGHRPKMHAFFGVLMQG